jgi:hypothetical protein
MRAVQFVTLCGLAALAAIPASADVFFYNFTSDHCSGGGGCSSNGALNPMGTITVQDFATNEVEVSVTLAPGFKFVSTGAGKGDSGDSSFFFETTSGSPITISGLSGGWSVPNLSGGTQPAGLYAGDGLMNDYNHGLLCSSCGNGGGGGIPGPLDFEVTLAGLTAANFASAPYFGADVISSNGNTGLIDASPAGHITTPEASSVMLFGSILIGVAGILRRRVKRKA